MEIDLIGLIEAVGMIGVFAIIFAETGLLIGFFLPGDSLLFTAGVLTTAVGEELIGFSFSLPVLAIGCFIAAVAGDTVGYWFGHRVGRGLFKREDSRFFKRKYLYQAEGLYEQHGGKIIVIARFMPFVRTFAPIVAGIGAMHYTRFLSYNVIGGFLWAVGVPIAGALLGNVIPAEDVDKYLLPIVAVIIIISVLPPAYHWWKARRAEQVEAAQMEQLAD